MIEPFNKINSLDMEIQTYYVLKIWPLKTGIKVSQPNFINFIIFISIGIYLHGVSSVKLY